MQRKMQPLAARAVAAELLLEAKGDTFREGRPCSDANGATAAGKTGRSMKKMRMMMN